MQTRSERWTLGLILAGCLGLTVWTVERLLPPTVPIIRSAILPCVSYAPFRDPQHSPFDPALQIDSTSLRSDLAKIRSVTGCVRTYGLDHGMDAMPGLAREMGLRLRLGIWLGQDAAANRREIERAVTLAQSYPDVIEEVIVGNEVLLRGDLTAQALAEILSEVQDRIDLPISYADVWEFWRRHAEVLLPHVDHIAVHILPYWEDEPIAVNEAVDYVYRRYAEMQGLFAPQPVWVGETGWPARGRSRGPATPGVYEQASFIHGLLQRHQTEPLPFNLIESFDQPWKRIQEGAMGGAWGIFEASGARRVDWHARQSQTAERIALGGLLVAWCIGFWLLWRNHAHGWAWFLAFFVLGLLAAQVQWAMVWSRNPAEWAGAWAEMTIGLILSMGLTHQILRRRFPLWPEWSGLRRLTGPFLVLWMVAVGLDAYGLITDGRYRGFGWPFVVGPLVLSAAAAVMGMRGLWRPNGVRLLALGLGLGGLVIVYQEGLENTQALVYSQLLVAVTVTAFVAGHRVGPASLASEDGAEADQADSRSSGST
ncbi:MAG: hypothetical protein RLZZ344_9 [Pseudomonadota bacterium]